MTSRNNTLKQILGEGFYLKIEAASLSDQGVYKCVAENSLGCYLERKATLSVNEADDNDEGKQRLSKSSEKGLLQRIMYT